MDQDSRDYHVDFIAAGASRLISRQPCELVWSHVDTHSAATDVVIYDGIDTNGDIIVDHNKSNDDEHNTAPPVPLYCKRGLYVSVPSNSGGLTVQWRERTDPVDPQP